MKCFTLRKWWLPTLLTAAFAASPSAFADKKSTRAQVRGDLSVLVLGSGGPAANSDGRASAGYLIFTDGEPRILMDAGGGTFQRLAASGINIKDVEIVLLSHLHIDHMSDLPAFVKTIYFHNRAAGTERTAPIRIYGPDTNGVGFPPAFPTTANQYPPTTEFADGHFHLSDGLERYLHVFAPAIGAGDFNYQAFDVSPDPAAGMQTVLVEPDGLTVDAIGVNHGPAPSLAFRIGYAGQSIVFSGDTNSSTDNMIKISEDADLLIYDTAILENTPPDGDVVAALHTRPSRMGEVADAAEPDHLVLSHITAVTDGNIGQVKRIVRRQGYDGRISEARDLKVYDLDQDGSRYGRDYDDDEDDDRRRWHRDRHDHD